MTFPWEKKKQEQEQQQQNQVNNNNTMSYSPTEKPTASPPFGYNNNQQPTIAVASNSSHNVQEAEVAQKIYTGSPLYVDDAQLSPKVKAKFVVDGYKDVYFIPFFIINVLITMGVGVRNFSVGLVPDNQQQATTTTTTTVPRTTATSADSSNNNPQIALSDLTNGTLTGLGFVLLLIVVMLALLKKFTSHFIVFSVGFLVVLMFLSGIFVALQNPGASIANFLFATLFGLWFYFARKRIPLASAMLEVSTRVLTAYPANFLLSFCTCLVTIIYFIFWCGFVFPSLLEMANHDYNSTQSVQQQQDGRQQQQQQQDGDLTGPTFVFLYGLLVLYWVSEAATAVLKVTVSGVVATHYFVGGEMSAMPKNPTLASFKRSMTYSFGSILFGSLLVAIVRTLHWIARNAAKNNRNSFVACIAECLLRWLENLLKFFNNYAWSYIAIYGLKYTDAASATMDLIQTSFVSAVINDDLTGITMGIINLFDSLIAAAISCAIYGGNGAVFAIVFLLSLVIHSLIFTCITAGVTCLFVCFAEEPQVLNSHNPEIRRKIDEAIEIAKESPCGGGLTERQDQIETGQQQRNQSV